MIRYWDSSALIDAIHDSDVLSKALESGQSNVTRPHALAEVFSTLTGGRLGFKYQADDAARLIEELTQGFAFVDLTADEVKSALLQCQAKGVRGGRVHDWLHAVAARKSGASELLTDNLADFSGLEEGYTLAVP
jgi:predicted nucleic acid-binding protein